jgi:hypothetical protein
VSDPTALFDQLVSERGGRDVLSLVELAVCRQLAQVLASDGANASAITALSALLPPVGASSPLPVDAWDKLSDRELSVLEEARGILDRLGGVLPPPTPFDSEVALQTALQHAREEAVQLNELVRIANSAEARERELREGAVEEMYRLRARVQELETALSQADHSKQPARTAEGRREASQQQSNVVPMHGGSPWTGLPYRS